MMLSGCTHFSVDDCPDGVLGNNEPGSARLRTSHYRVMLADPAAAAARFLPYSIMSAYAYRLGDGCRDRGNDNRILPERAALLTRWLQDTAGSSGAWQSAATADMRGLPDALKRGCEDETGLMFHVWHRNINGSEEVVLAFRGTSGAGDWRYGNLWWFSRAFTADTQLSRARAYAQEVMRHFNEKALSEKAPPPRYITTGHSLGGSLAQHVLYAFPRQVEQAIVFDTSSVTGFVDPSISRDDRVDACACKPELGPEARIIRVYQTYEILANLRIFHKLILPPERHVQEVRFPFDAPVNPVSRHGIGEFTDKLHERSKTRRRDEVRQSWIASADNRCTAPLIKFQSAACSIVPEKNSAACPQ